MIQQAIISAFEIFHSDVLISRSYIYNEILEFSRNKNVI